MRRTQRNNKRWYRVKKTSAKDQLIDRQILVIHAAIVDKLFRHPELIPELEQSLEQKREHGRLGYGAYITWYSLLQLFDSAPESFRQGVLEDSGKMRRLRRKTPLVGILTEDERQKALAQNALGEMDLTNLLY